MTRAALVEIGAEAGLIMLAIALALSLVAIGANAAFKRYGVPHDDGDE